jgi:sigma-B regulation protein RsbU (phosphoserine phosphatase)
LRQNIVAIIKKINALAKSSIERLRFCNFKLKTLLEITQSINSNAPIDQLLHNFKKLLSTDLNIGKFILYSNLQKNWELWLDYGIEPEEYEKINVEKDLLPIRTIEITIGENESNLKNFDFIIPIFKNEDVIAYVLIGDVDNEQIGLSPSIQHLQFIQTLANIIMVAIQNKELVKESFEKERLKKELEMAAKIQAMLVPSPEHIPQRKQIQIIPFYMSHYEVGGDLYDFGEISKNEIYFCIADVSGKGMSAAMIMSHFQANLRAIFKNKKNISFKQIVRKLNNTIVEVSKGSHFVTMFLAKYNILTHRLKYVNAGHLPPILYDYKTQKLNFLQDGCPGIGMLDEIPNIKTGNIRITNKSKLLCFTDGLSEYSIGNNHDYGFFVTKESMLRRELNIEQTINHIIEKLQINKENKMIFDDITILGIQFNSSENIFKKQKN